jgi:hypothetical protein
VGGEDALDGTGGIRAEADGAIEGH